MDERERPERLSDEVLELGVDEVIKVLKGLSLEEALIILFSAQKRITGASGEWIT